MELSRNFSEICIQNGGNEDCLRIFPFAQLEYRSGEKTSID
jgi:hypothetical protein